MNFRTRLALGFVAAAALPLAILGIGVRREMTARLDQQAGQRVSALIGVLREYLDVQHQSVRNRLRALSQRLAEDNRFRLATGAGSPPERRWLLDWAGEAMATGGLDVLRVMDPAGRVLSSGHFRNEYDRLDPELIALLTRAGGPALVRLPLPDGDRLALAAVDSLGVAGRRYLIAGGMGFDAARAAALVPQDEIGVTLVLDSTVTPGAAAEIPLRYYDAVEGRVREARLVVTRDPAPMLALRGRVDRWLLGAAGLALLIAAAAGLLAARQISRPLAELAEQTARLDLDRLDPIFAAGRDDEIGTLSDTLAAMTARLRSSTARLREAERRAATGDLARQINHDVKNGLGPIRHVLRHLSDVAAKSPEQLAGVFQERQSTLESSVAYLEDLARNYARLAPATDRGQSDLGGLVREIAIAAARPGIEFEVRTAEGLPPVRADLVALRRIVENLVSNAVDALEGKPGRITLAAAVPNGSGPASIRLSVTDTGRGMSGRELEQAFDDFHTTKSAGTGLGLSVVRRLVADLGGSLRVETSPGQGSTFTVELPAA